VTIKKSLNDFRNNLSLQNYFRGDCYFYLPIKVPLPLEMERSRATKAPKITSDGLLTSSESVPTNNPRGTLLERPSLSDCQKQSVKTLK
jgi:hypothetical protein